MSATAVDQAVTQLFLSAVSPAKVEIALAALEELDAARRESCRQWELQLQQADYDVELARRRYEEVDPANRLVAGELEARWEQALSRRAQLQRDCAEQEHRHPSAVNQRDRQLVRELSGDLERVWNAKTTSMEDRKMLLRFLVKRVHLDGVTESGKIRIDVEWHTGAHNSTVIDRPLVGVWAPKTSQTVLDRIQELTADHDYAAIAETLNREELRSAKGLPFNAFTVGYVVRTRGWSNRR
jgi:hypothetical protein